MRKAGFILFGVVFFIVNIAFADVTILITDFEKKKMRGIYSFAASKADQVEVTFLGLDLNFAKGPVDIISVREKHTKQELKFDLVPPHGTITDGDHKKSIRIYHPYPESEGDEFEAEITVEAKTDNIRRESAERYVVTYKTNQRLFFILPRQFAIVYSNFPILTDVREGNTVIEARQLNENYKERELVFKIRSLNPFQAVKAYTESEDAKEIETAGIEEDKKERDGLIIKENASEKKEETGYYITQKGDSLALIAGKEKIFGDPLKWNILYLLNQKKLDEFNADGSFPHKELMDGIRLKYTTPDEVRENLAARPKDLWVINLLSDTSKENIFSETINFIKKGYPVYISKKIVNGKEWMRVRLGFFNNKEDAVKEADNLMGIFNITDLWTSKIGEREIAEFSGY